MKMSKKESTLKIYPGRIRAFLGFVIGAALGILLILNRDKIPQETPWYMYVFLCVMPLLAIVAGLKNSLFPAPIIIIYKDGLSYPKIGLQKLLWKDIQGTHLLPQVVKTRLRTYFSPNDSDRCLEIFIADNSESLNQFNTMGRVLLSRRDKHTVLPIALMGAKTSTAELQKIIEKARDKTNS
jgi:hypothetical protein